MLFLGDGNLKLGVGQRVKFITPQPMSLKSCYFRWSNTHRKKLKNQRNPSDSGKCVGWWILQAVWVCLL